MTFIARVNNGVLYRSEDGREAWVLFNKETACFCTDIYGKGQPNNAVIFTKQALVDILKLMEELP